MSSIIVFILSSLILRGFCLEPACSKFAYDEQLLEKMIRMEVNAERKEEINRAEREAVKKSFAVEIDALKTENDNLRSINERIENDFERLKNEFSILSTEFSGLASKYNDTKGRREKIIFFTVAAVKNTDPSIGDVVLFKTVNVNVGDAFDVTSGKFTVPVDGLYLFHDQICVKNGKDFYHSFYVNGKEETKERYANDSEYPTCHTAVLTRMLKAGHTVSVRCRGQNKDGVRLIDDSERKNTFTGILMTQN